MNYRDLKINYADLILAQINSPDFDETMLEYIFKNDDPTLFVEKTYSIREKNLIDAFIKKGKQNLLCAILERFPSLAKIQDEFGYTFLFDAAHEKLEQVCLKALDFVDMAKVQNVHGETFVHEAMKEQLEEVGLKALKIPELVEIQDKNGNTFLHIAAYVKIKQVCLKAQKNAEYAQIKNINNQSYLDIAKKNEMFEENKKPSTLMRLLEERKRFLKEQTEKGKNK